LIVLLDEVGIAEHGAHTLVAHLSLVHAECHWQLLLQYPYEFLKLLGRHEGELLLVVLVELGRAQLELEEVVVFVLSCACTASLSVCLLAIVALVALPGFVLGSPLVLLFMLHLIILINYSLNI
jgi:hypothetical protein